MSQLHNQGYYPLTEYSVRSSVPERAGIYLLAVKSGDNRFRNFYATYSDNLTESLLQHLNGEQNYPAMRGNDGLRPPCYFAFVLFSAAADLGNGVGKLMQNTNDPVSRLDVINCN